MRQCVIIFLVLGVGAILGVVLLRQQPSSLDFPVGQESTKEVILVEDENGEIMKEKEIYIQSFQE